MALSPFGQILKNRGAVLVLFSLISFKSDGASLSEEARQSTVSAVPLQEDELSTSTLPYQENDENNEDDIEWVSLNTNQADNYTDGMDYVEDRQDESETGAVGSEDQSTATTAATTSQVTDQQSTGNSYGGEIAWSPYRSLRRGELDLVQSPVTLPFKNPMVLFPNISSLPKGRWYAEDKERAQLMNVKPAFILPKVKVIEQNDENQSSEDQQLTREKRDTKIPGPVVASCGGTYRDLYGIIQSPEFPLYYPNNKKCLYDIQLPSDNYTVKVTCETFIMQGGDNCSHDYILASPSGNKSFEDGMKYCGIEPPIIESNGSKLLLQFNSDDLFRYQGFSCRYRAMQLNGIAVIGTFGNTTENAKPQSGGSSFLQVVQCPALGNNVDIDGAGSGGQSSGSSSPSVGGGSASLYSGLWNGACGNQNLPPQDRIVGGYETKEHEYPWMAPILKKCGTEYCQICGATIISEEWVLTGAHCTAKIPLEDLGVMVGGHSLFSVNNNQKFIKVKQMIIHPDYNTPTPLNNDIGLLRLEYPIVFTRYVSPLCLPALGESGFQDTGNSVNKTTLETVGMDIVGKNATVLGWGMINDDGIYAESLRGVEVEILSNEECNRLYGIMTETMMCTSGNNGRGTCYGDSGGPAVVRQPDGTFVQVGILSFGALAGCELGYPSGQVLVHWYIDWIQAVTGVAFGATFG